MQFVTLDAVLCAIGARVELSESARIADVDEQVWMQNINESYFRYSKAAGLLDHHLVTAKSERLPRWLDTRDGTGYPRPSDAARDDGMRFLLEQASWYPKWLKYHREFSARGTHIGGRWGGPPTAADYMRDSPPNPAFSEQFSKRVQEVCFDVSGIIDFLDFSAIPHALSLPDASESGPVGGRQSQSQDVDVVDTSPTTGDVTAPVESKSLGTWGKNESRGGRKCPIEKAIQQARLLAAPASDDVEAVFEQLIKLARKCPETFPPLKRYENGQVLYGHNGKELPYTKDALAEFLRRRKRLEKAA